MDEYLIDTSVLVAYLRGFDEGLRDLERLFEHGHALGTCPVVVTEIFAGVRENEMPQTEELINSLRFYPVTREIAKLAGEYIRHYGRKGITLSLADTTIAAVAVSYKLKLLTYNKKHYPMIFRH